MDEDILDPWRIMAWFGLRVNFYLMAEDGYDFEALLRRCTASGTFDSLNDDERLGLYAWCMRSYYWSTLMPPEPRDIWTAAVSLFPLTCWLPVPEKYVNDRAYPEWEQDYADRIGECVAIIAEVEHRTKELYAAADAGIVERAQHGYRFVGEDRYWPDVMRAESQ